MKYRIIVVACILPILHIAPAGAFVESPCWKILAEEFYNGYSRSNAQLRDQVMYAKLCSSNFKQARQAINRAHRAGAVRAMMAVKKYWLVLGLGDDAQKLDDVLVLLGRGQDDDGEVARSLVRSNPA